jgi:hypothetical protein
MHAAVLWLFVINLGVAFGAGLYERRIVAPRWLTRSVDTGLTGTPIWSAATTPGDGSGLS